MTGQLICFLLGWWIDRTIYIHTWKKLSSPNVPVATSLTRFTAAQNPQENNEKPITYPTSPLPPTPREPPHGTFFSKFTLRNSTFSIPPTGKPCQQATHYPKTMNVKEAVSHFLSCPVSDCFMSSCCIAWLAVRYSLLPLYPKTKHEYFFLSLPSPFSISTTG